MEIVRLGGLLLIGCIGWIVFRYLKVPSPGLLGSLAFIGAIRVSGIDLPVSPDWFGGVTQIFLGFYIGSSLTKKTIGQIGTILLPAIVVMIWAVSTSFLGGGVVSALTLLDLKTGVLSMSTGGITEMVILALEIDADTITVVVLQTLRVVVTMSLYPLIAKFVLKKQKSHSSQFVSDIMQETEQSREQEDAMSIGKLIASMFFATIGGLFFTYLRVPAGAMIGSLAFMVIANLTGFGVTVSSPKILGFLLVGVGITVSDSITPATMQALLSSHMLITVLVTLLFSFVSSAFITLLIHKLTKWDLVTCILACAPAGLSLMPILAIEADLNPLPISLLHLSRLFIIKASVPIIGALLS